MKEVVISQQHTLEDYERERRQLNLIFSGIPAAALSVGGEHCFKDDESKVNFLCDQISSKFDSDSIASCTLVQDSENHAQEVTG